MGRERTVPNRRLIRAVGVAAVLGGLLLASATTPRALEGPEPGFTITSTLTALPDCSEPALLAPGVPRCLTYTVHNPQPVPVTVSSLAIQNVSAPTGCLVSNLDLSRSTFTGALVAPPLGTNAVSVDITLLDLPSNQDRCQGVSFTFEFTGTSASGAVLGVTTPGTGVMVQSTLGLLLVGAGLLLLIAIRRRRPDAEQDLQP